MKVHYILPIHRCAYANLQQMIAEKVIKADPEARLQHDRLRGELFVPSRQIPLEPLADNMAKVQDYHLATDLYRLPSAEYTALIRNAFNFIQPLHMTEILQKVALHPSDYTSQQARRSKPHLPAQILSLPCEPIFEARWMDTDWACLQRSGEWFVVLWFDLICTASPTSIVGTESVALDLGACPLVCAVGDSGSVTNINAPTVNLSSFNLDAGEESYLKSRLQFEFQRAELLRFTFMLICIAQVVYTEDLTYRDMDKKFVRWARSSGLIDWHESWLHNRLAAAGIPLEKVDARGTSQQCSVCQHPHGHRLGSNFCCPKCGSKMDAHENAARNILARGIIKSQQWRDAHVRTRQRRQQVVV